MPYTVEIREVATGETVTTQQPFDWVHPNGQDSMFWWTEGNYGCDTNRSMEFWRGKGASEDEVSQRTAHVQCCNASVIQAYLVRITLPDGTVVMDEFDDEQQHRQREINAPTQLPDIINLMSEHGRALLKAHQHDRRVIGIVRRGSPDGTTAKTPWPTDTGSIRAGLSMAARYIRERGRSHGAAPGKRGAYGALDPDRLADEILNLMPQLRPGQDVTRE